MSVIVALFWAVLAIIAYIYLGYPLWAYLWSRLRPRGWKRADIDPPVTIIMAVRNGAARLRDKIDHLLTLDYPAERVEVIVVSDGSDDGTNEILTAVTHPRLIPIICPEHRGKAAAVNEGLRRARGELVVFVDIRPKLEADAVRRLVSNFADPGVGCAAGELCLRTEGHDSNTQAVSSLYWRYEQQIRKWEAIAGSPVGVYGGFYAVRRELARELPPGLILDDMYQPLGVVCQGYRSVLDESARVWDIWPRTSAGEFKRKVRTLAGNFQLVQVAPWLFDRKYGLRFQLISHKLLRLLTPYLLLLLLLLSCWLRASQPYSGLLVAQALFYALALIELAWDIPFLRRIAGPASAFALLNAAAVVALFRFLFMRQSLWELWVPAESRPPAKAAATSADS